MVTCNCNRVTQRQAAGKLRALSGAFAEAWRDRNLVEGRSSYDARDAVLFVREGMAPKKALLLIGFPLDIR